jgi:hypothetical protein
VVALCSEDGGTIVIRIVNTAATPVTIAPSLLLLGCDVSGGTGTANATITTLFGNSLTEENTPADPTRVQPVSRTVPLSPATGGVQPVSRTVPLSPATGGVPPSAVVTNLTVPPHSFSVLQTNKGACKRIAGASIFTATVHDYTPNSAAFIGNTIRDTAGGSSIPTTCSWSPPAPTLAPAPH